MKKTNNKGFSLVELIIVIAIMAILAGAIAPALIRYIDKSRKSNDVTAAKSIKTAVETALGNESIYEYLTTAGKDAIIVIEPGQPTSTAQATSYTSDAAVKIVVAGTCQGISNTDMGKKAAAEIGTNIGEKTPKIKYKKASKNGCGTTTVTPKEFVVIVTQKGAVEVYLAADGTDDSFTASKGLLLSPEVCDSYQ